MKLYSLYRFREQRKDKAYLALIEQSIAKISFLSDLRRNFDKLPIA